MTGLVAGLPLHGFLDTFWSELIAPISNEEGGVQALCDMGFSAIDIITTLFRIVRNYNMHEFLKLEFIRVSHLYPVTGVIRQVHLGLKYSWISNAAVPTDQAVRDAQHMQEFFEAFLFLSLEPHCEIVSHP